MTHRLFIGGPLDGQIRDTPDHLATFLYPLPPKPAKWTDEDWHVDPMAAETTCSVGVYRRYGDAWRHVENRP